MFIIKKFIHFLCGFIEVIKQFLFKTSSGSQLISSCQILYSWLNDFYRIPYLHFLRTHNRIGTKDFRRKSRYEILVYDVKNISTLMITILQFMELHERWCLSERNNNDWIVASMLFSYIYSMKYSYQILVTPTDLYHIIFVQ